MEEVCHDCGEKRENLSKHWYMSSECDYPHLSKDQKEIITGLLMGDGSLNFWKNSSRNCRLQVKMINKHFLEYLSGKLGVFSNDVKLINTAKEQAEQCGKAFGVEAKEENYNDVYVLQTKSVPELNEFTNWYTEDSGKVWPDNIDMTPNVLKYWYISDGTLDNSAHHSHILISCSSERHNKEKVENYFINSDLPVPSRWNESERKSGGWRCNIAFTKEDSRKLFKYMGEAPPGFEYKWPEDLS